jgi:hypothetical protein
MAIIANGQVVERGNPETLIDSMAGKIWSKRVAKEEVPAYQENYRLVLAKLSGGSMMVFVHSDTDPGNGFRAERATLEDIYFSKIN